MKFFGRIIYLIIFAGVFLFSHPVHSQSENSVQFSKKLNQEGIFDYSEFLLKKVMAANPSDIDRLKVQLAETYILQDRTADASAILKQITASSPFFISAQLATGMLFMQKNNVDQAISAFTSYLNSLKDNYPPDEQGKADYRMIVYALVNAYKMKEDSAKITQTFKLLENIKDDPNDIALSEAFAQLDVAQSMKDAKKAGWDKIIAGKQKILEDLKWGAEGPAPLFAEIGAARALYMLGKYDDALKALAVPWEKYRIVDDAFADKGEFEKSPGIARRYFEACCYLAKATAEKNPELKKKYYIDALKKYVYIQKKAPDFQYEKVVFDTIQVIKAALEKLGAKVTLPDDLKSASSSMDLLKQQDAKSSSGSELDQLFIQKKYDKVIEYVTEKLAKDKDAALNDDVLSKFAIALASTKKYLEAMSVCSYLIANWPSSQAAAAALFQTGNIIWSAGYTNDAKIVYEKLISAAMMSQLAGDAAAKIAKDNYDRALALLNSSYSATGDDKSKKYSAAVSAYTDALPSLKRVVETYAYRADLYSSAVFMLAQAYTVMGRYNEAAAVYDSYCKNEKDDKLKLLNSKLGAADAYWRNGRSYESAASQRRQEAVRITDKTAKSKKLEEAELSGKNAKDAYALCIDQLKELLEKWAAPGGIIGNTTDPKMISSIQSAQMLLAWTYDICGDKQKACAELQKFIDKYPTADKAPMCLARMASMYYELNDTAATSKVLENLNLKYPQSIEAKNAYFSIGKNMYEKGNFSKSFEVFSKLLGQASETSVANLNWIAENLANCKDEHPKEGALLAFKAATILLEKLEKPELSDWLAPAVWNSIKDDKEAQAQTIAIMKQKLSFNAGYAAVFAGDRGLALKYLDEVIAKRGPYYYNAKFAKADLFLLENNFQDTRRELAEIAETATVSEKYSVAAKAKCLIGDTFLIEKNYRKAMGVFAVIAMSLNESQGLFDKVMAFKNETERRNISDERGAEKEWLENALYKAAFSASRLDDGESKKKFTTLYKKYFPSGRYAKDIEQLPGADTGTK